MEHRNALSLNSPGTKPNFKRQVLGKVVSGIVRGLETILKMVPDQESIQNRQGQHYLIDPHSTAQTLLSTRKLLVAVRGTPKDYCNLARNYCTLAEEEKGQIRALYFHTAVDILDNLPEDKREYEWNSLMCESLIKLSGSLEFGTIKTSIVRRAYKYSLSLTSTESDFSLTFEDRNTIALIYTEFANNDGRKDEEDRHQFYNDSIRVLESLIKEETTPSPDHLFNLGYTYACFADDNEDSDEIGSLRSKALENLDRAYKLSGDPKISGYIESLKSHESDWNPPESSP